ncbi:Hypothetical predicted protein, partial [Paramuricea clavata]
LGEVLVAPYIPDVMKWGRESRRMGNEPVHVRENPQETFQVLCVGWTLEVQDRVDTRLRNPNPRSVDLVAEEGNTGLGHLALLDVNLQLLPLQELEDRLKMLKMFVVAPACDYNVVDVHESERAGLQELLDVTLECLPAVPEAERHSAVPEQSKRSRDRGFVDILLRHLHLMIGHP